MPTQWPQYTCPRVFRVIPIYLLIGAYSIVGAFLLMHSFIDDKAKLTDMVTSLSTLGLLAIGLPTTLLAVSQMRHRPTATPDAAITALEARIADIERKPRHVTFALVDRSTTSLQPPTSTVAPSPPIATKVALRNK